MIGVYGLGFLNYTLNHRKGKQMYNTVLFKYSKYTAITQLL